MKTIPFCLCRFSFIIASTLLVPHVSAETVTVNGTSGASGADGGGNGYDGSSATAYAVNSFDAENDAAAYGGNGGNGGNGANSSGDPPWAGSGGAGGVGGDATAFANTVRPNGGDARATAEATGGRGGNGGHGGNAGDDDLASGGGGIGGEAGSATATATASTTDGSVHATAQASGGEGGSGGDGGSGGSVVGHGGAGSCGNSAHASASGSNSSNDPVFVSAIASGGNGGSGGSGGPGASVSMAPAGRGWTATLGTVNGSSAGGGPVTVQGRVFGGNGGTGLDGGSGANASLTNAISGSTSGSLYLEQKVYGGSGGYGRNQGGAGGSATSILNHTDTTAAFVVAGCHAYGGSAGNGDSQAGDSGGATAQLNLTSAGDISSANVSAQGAQGGSGPAGNPGAAGQILPSSVVSTGTGKTVSLSVEQTGGEGGNGYQPGDTGGDGADSHMTNIVSGSAPGGHVDLTQTASAGSGPDGGDAGDASSTLILPGGNPGGGSLKAVVEANGGDARPRNLSQTHGTAGNATAVCELHNAGDVTAEAQANPGSAGYVYDTSPAAANATALAICTVPFRQAYARAHQQLGKTAASGTLSATARSFGGIFSEVSAMASAPSTIIASPSVGCRFAQPPLEGGSLMVDALPSQDYSFPSTEGMLTLAQINVTGGFTNGSTTLVMNPAGFTGSLKLGLTSGSGDFDNGLTSVQFTVTRGGSSLINQTFTDAPALAAYFDSQVIDLGPVGLVAGQPLSFSFTLSGASTGFSASMYLAAQPQAPFVGWATGYGLANVINYNADSDLDGESDLLEFAFNSNPLNGSKGSHLPVQILADRLRIQFTRRRGDTQGLTYLMETSTTLAGPAAWQLMAHPWTIVSNPLNDTMESVTCEIPREEAPESLFIRMKVQAE